MKELVSYTPVVLDPNTAHPALVLSEDLTTARRGPRQKLPENPERFDSMCPVLGSEGFDSGIHSWDVEVGDNPAWFLGVADESVERKGITWTRMWRIGFFNGIYKVFVPSKQPVVLAVMKKLRRIRLYLDWRRGYLSFSDVDTDRHTFSFRHRFTQKMFPYFSSSSEFPIRILPQLDDCDSSGW
ncbi:Zinc-binding protein A33 [Liparis tanakae]|uniref:Zinc-binding protein A33 n=1 Tax=Liparis tanakae TaxID=230148 RepID=A0A4Z2ELD3_9TELE|nr:Zinc-binding protein A33 [Liparis tanakae]